MTKRDLSFAGPGEKELEKALQPRFKEYEEWRTAQLEAHPVDKSHASEAEKPQKKGFGKMDIIFLVLGVVAAMIWKQCTAK